MSEEYKNTPEDEDIPNIEESSLIGASDADQEKEDTSSLSRPEETSEKPSISVTENSSTDMASIVAAAASEAISAALSAVHPQKDQTADLQLLSEQIAALKKEVGDLREELNTSKADLESIKKSTLYETAGKISEHIIQRRWDGTTLFRCFQYYPAYTRCKPTGRNGKN